MRISIKSVHRSFDFDMPRIIAIFEDKTAEDQVKFIRCKLHDLVILDEAKLNFIDRLKRRYLLKTEYTGLILNGLLYQALTDLME